MCLLRKKSRMKNYDSTLIYWNRGDGMQLSPNFSNLEFECKCGKCILQYISMELVSRLQRIRDVCGPIEVTSAFRCATHQANLRSKGYQTTVGKSQHELGYAADVRSKDLNKLGEALKKEFLA